MSRTVFLMVHDRELAEDQCPSCRTTLAWRTVDDDVVFDQVDRTRAGSLARWLWQGRWDYQG